MNGGKCLTHEFRLDTNIPVYRHITNDEATTNKGLCSSVLSFPSASWNFCGVTGVNSL